MDEAKVATDQEAKSEALATASPANTQIQNIWGSPKEFTAAAKMAQFIAQSDLIPNQSYRGKPANCLIAMEMAQRTGFSLLHVMQNLYIIQGKPSWSGQFCTAAVNGSGKFSPLDFVRLTNEDGSTRGYYAQATRLSDGKICVGSPVDWDMVKAEGWLDKSGSKWKTMPDLMFHYRAAAFFVREFCPEVLCGLQTAEEVQDVKGYETERKTTVISLD